MTTASIHAASPHPESERPQVSVIIGFKDRGLGRLELCINTIHDSLDGLSHEIIIADYGSSTRHEIAALARRTRAIHEVVETDGEWSAARARNAGARVASGGILLAADADMLFTPAALKRVVGQLERHPQEVVILQCRDLPVGYTDEVVREEGLDWERFARLGQLRPRWGVGGLVGLHRELWERLRGWDERMHTYGGEDTDFAKRVRRIGARIDWLDEPAVAMYHMWHPSATFTATRDRATRAAVAANREIHTTDETYVRNIETHRYLPTDLPPIVTVILRPTSGSPLTYEPALGTVLSQTVSDIEVVLLANDGSVHVDDDRVRSLGADSLPPRGTFTAYAQADEMWSADRLAVLLSHFSAKVGLVTDATAVCVMDDDGSILKGPHFRTHSGFNARGTIVRSDLLLDPISADLSWVDATVRAASHGPAWTTVPNAYRTTAVTPLSEESTAAQWKVDAAKVSGALARSGLDEPSASDSIDLAVNADLGEILNSTQASARFSAPATSDLEGIRDEIPASTSWEYSSITTPGGSKLWQSVEIRAANLTDLAVASRRLRLLGATRSDNSRPTPQLGIPSGNLTPRFLIEYADKLHGNGRLPSYWLVGEAASIGDHEMTEALRATPGVNLVLERRVTTVNDERIYIMAHLQARKLLDALRMSFVVDQGSTLELFKVNAITSENGVGHAD